MKKTFLLLLFLPVFCSYAQENIPEKSVIVLTTFTIPDRSVTDTLSKAFDIDTLMNIYMRGVRLNPMIKSQRILIHYYGPDSYKILFITEIDALRNLDKAEEKTITLINSELTNETKRKEFWRIWSRLFDRHEDSLMQDFVNPK